MRKSLALMYKTIPSISLIIYKQLHIQKFLPLMWFSSIVMSLSFIKNLLQLMAENWPNIWAFTLISLVDTWKIRKLKLDCHRKLNNSNLDWYYFRAIVSYTYVDQSRKDWSKFFCLSRLLPSTEIVHGSPVCFTRSDMALFIYIYIFFFTCAIGLKLGW